MNSIELFRMGIKNLWRRKLRTFLTILGVIIGTASIITMVSLGFGMNEGFKQELSRMGSLNIINVNPPYDMYYDGGKPSGPQQKKLVLDDTAVRKFSEIAGVEAVTPILESYVKIISGKFEAYVSIKGINPDVMEQFEFKLSDGRLLESGDTLNVVFGAHVNQQFYNPKARMRYGPPPQSSVNVMKDKLELTFDMGYSENQGKPKQYKINGVGILQEGDWEKDYSAFMPITQLKKMVDEHNKSQNNRNNNRTQSQSGYNRVMVKVGNIKEVQKIQQQIKDMGFNAYSLSDYLDSLQKTSSILQAVLGGIGAISLLVAALGITNTMVMSIYERTREIGIMKVIGASLKDIRRLFLFEAGMIGFTGGLLGVILSKIASYILNSIGFRFVNFFGPGGGNTKISIIPLWLILATLVFTTIVGLVSGFYPARRAMKLSALEAIRTE